MDGFSILISSSAHFLIVAALSVFFVNCQVRPRWCARINEHTGDAVCAVAKEALAVLLPMFLITSVGVFFIWYKHCHWRLVGFMCLFVLVGQFVGWLVFDHLTDHPIELFIGIIAVIIAANYRINILRAGAETKTPPGQRDISGNALTSGAACPAFQVSCPCPAAYRHRFSCCPTASAKRALLAHLASILW